MTAFALETEGLGKRYQLGLAAAPGYRTVRDSIARLWTKGTAEARGRGELWALEDVTLTVGEGEALGVIGRNGAGKSTLLKVISRITEPTKGLVRLRGRVASLLEVGTGFHPELTGRENVFLNGAILGMGRREILRRFDEIVSFSGVEAFLDTPVKRYSSGMYVRLAFAVAAHLDSEILIVDEVLAVGDAEFQKKCLGRMDAVARSGRTILFVSHNMAAISRFCSRVIWLRAGRLVAEGPARRVIGEYLSNSGGSATEWSPSSQSSGPFSYDRVSVVPAGAQLGAELAADEAFDVVFEYRLSRRIPPGRLSLLVTNGEGVVVLTSSSTDTGSALDEPWETGAFEARCRVPGSLLAPGRYTLTIGEPDGDGGYEVLHDVLSFTVSSVGSLVERDSRLGLIAPVLPWSRTRKGTA